LRGRAFGGDIADENTLGALESQGVGHGRRYVLNGGAEEAADHVAVLDDFVHDALGEVDGNRKTYALISSAVRKDGGIDADEFAAPVDERTAGISRIRIIHASRRGKSMKPIPVTRSSGT